MYFFAHDYNNPLMIIINPEPHAVPIDRILSVKNAWAWDKYSAPRTIEKMKILGAVLELPVQQHCQSSPFTSKLGQIGQIGSTV